VITDKYDNESQGLNESGWHHIYSFNPSHSLSYLSASALMTSKKALQVSRRAFLVRPAGAMAKGHLLLSGEV
jgi:hypothetical protein